MNQSDNKAVSKAAIPLTKGKRNMVMIGSSFLLLFLAASGSAVAVIQSVLLKQMDAMQHFALLSVCASVGTALMTPVGGKLGDMWGRKRVTIIACIIAIASLIGMTVATTFPVFLVSRVLLSFASGAFVSVPYILVRLINEPKDVPKSMGMMATFMSIGTLAGPMIAGFLSGAGMLWAAISFSGIFALVPIITYMIALPENKSPAPTKLDVAGVLLLLALILAFSLPLNFGAALGWANPIILGGLALMVVLLFVFIKVETAVEKKGIAPIVNMGLFKNGSYSVLLIVGICSFFYQGAMTSYGSLAAIQVLGAPVAITGTLLLPRTILTMLLPTFAGAWLGKKQGRSWKAMAIGTSVVCAAFLPLAFVSASTPLVLFYICFGITGFAESFRAVSVTPAAQDLLTPETLATGTALLNFFNTISGVLGAALYGALYNNFNAGGTDIAAGVRPVFGLAAGVALVGFVLVMLVVRKQQTKVMAEASAT